MWLGVALLGCLAFVCAVWIVWSNQREIARRQRLILYKTNPAVVLALCRQIRAKQALFRGNPDWHPTPATGGDYPDPADPRMPPVIAGLRPCTISILPGGVRIELGGGPYHFGVAEQLPGAPVPALAVKLLIPGLWYYAEDGKAPPP